VLELIPSLSLRSTPALAIDCQSTGATPAHGSLLEIGWALAGEEASSQLVAIPDGAEIPHHVKRITGIREEDLAGAASPEQAWCRVARAARRTALASGLPRAITVVHFASFERRFLEDLWERFGAGSPFPFELVCTHEIAQRLLPDLPRRGLRALSGYFGNPVHELRRSRDHAQATAELWVHLARRLEDERVHTLSDLRAWIRETPKGAPRARGFPMPRALVKELPDAPGVYRMRRIDGSLLYVGKATSLKKRVASYFTKKKTGVADRTLEMLSQARALDFARTETALEAALLEHDEIKTCDPPYNVALKNDATRCFFASKDLSSLAQRSDEVHRVGPLRDPKLLLGAVALARALEGAQFDRNDVLGVPRAYEPEDEMFSRGLALLLEKYALARPGLRELLALGARIEEVGEDEEEEEAESPEGWTPEIVVEQIEKRLVRASRALSRARWLRMIAESSVSFAAGDRRRVLSIAGGTIASRSWQPLDALPPMPAGSWRSASDRRASLDLAAHDRLRILSTELRRELACGADPIVRCGPASMLRGARLARVLRRV
jgi:DNA polymerase III subunit epsilon